MSTLLVFAFGWLPTARLFRFSVDDDERPAVESTAWSRGLVTIGT
jgi:hypothetical protein